MIIIYYFIFIIHVVVKMLNTAALQFVVQKLG